MSIIKDIGLVNVDCYNNIYRWLPFDRKLISDFLPDGPGWVPEHYITYIRTLDDYAYLRPSEIYHCDGQNDNNNPYNLVSRDGSIKPSKLLIKDPNDTFEYEFVYNGFLQNTMSRIIAIPRCRICGIPIIEHLGFDTKTESDIFHDVCMNCNNETLGMIDCILPKVTNYAREISDNIAIDYNRGLSIKDLFQKYKHIPNIEHVMADSIDMSK